MDVTHGGDGYGFRLRHGRPPLDFSASLNPLGMPAAVRAAACAAVEHSADYPDPFCRRLIAGLAAHLGVPERFLFCANGAADVIYRLALAARPRTALVPAPAFAEYERALDLALCRVQFHALTRDHGFALREDILDRITPALDLLFLCQPNNPTGRLIEPELLSAILERCAKTGTRLFLDACFCPFVDDPEGHSLIGRAATHPNLFILGSFTKLYAMAGIRLGYGVCGDAALVSRLHRAGPPWAVSTVAQEAGLAALAETGYVAASREAVRLAKPVLVDGLARLGFEVFGFDANFVFFRADLPDLDAKLADKGIAIRNCGTFRGLEPGYYRVSVRTERENARLLRALADCLDKTP